MTNEPIKITDLATLQREKQRLKMFCSFQEEKLKDKIIFIKLNYAKIISDEFLPFNHENNNTVSNVLDWVNEFVLGKILRMDLGEKSNLSGSLVKVAEVLIIRLFSKLVKK